MRDLETHKRPLASVLLRLLRALAVLEWSDRPEADEHLHRLAWALPGGALP